MQEETKLWLAYSEENLEAAELLMQSGLFNACLHNVQQTIEKSLKALIIENSVTFKKTHSISELKLLLNTNNITVDLTDDEIEFIDSIYIPTKYPVGSALPYFLSRRYNLQRFH